MESTPSQAVQIQAPSETLSGEQAGYDRWAAVYDHDANPLPALEERWMKAICTLYGGKAAQGIGKYDGARLEVILGPSGNFVLARIVPAVSET